MFHKILICSGDSFKAMRKAMSELTYEARMSSQPVAGERASSASGHGFPSRGFIITLDSPSVIEGTYYYTATEKVEDIDKKTLKTVEGKRERLKKAAFKLDLKHGLASSPKRDGLSALFEACDAMPDVGLEFSDLTLNLKDYVFEMQHAFNKNEIRSIKIREYLCRENMTCTGTFKVLDVREGEKLVEKFSDQLDGVTLSFKLPSGKTQFTISRKGEIKASPETPQELLDYAYEQLPRFHEAEVETAEVRDPVKA